jgi:hypothetical protein
MKTFRGYLQELSESKLNLEELPTLEVQGKIIKFNDRKLKNDKFLKQINKRVTQVHITKDNFKDFITRVIDKAYDECINTSTNEDGDTCIKTLRTGLIIIFNKASNTIRGIRNPVSEGKKLSDYYCGSSSNVLENEVYNAYCPSLSNTDVKNIEEMFASTSFKNVEYYQGLKLTIKEQNISISCACSKILELEM